MKKKQLFVMVAMMLLVAMVSVAGTMAFLTSLTNPVTNTFEVGNVKITLDEAKVTVYGEADGNSRVTTNNYKLVPGHEYIKDPTVHVDADSEDCWLFVKVENGISTIELAGDTTIAKQMEDKGWTPVANALNVYAYKETVSAGENVVVFNSFTLAGNADVAAYTDAKIIITAYAVQADNFGTAAAAWAAAPTNWQ